MDPRINHHPKICNRINGLLFSGPSQRFAQLRAGIASGSIKSPSAEINEIKMVPLTELAEYDLFSADDRFLRDDLPRLVQPSQPGKIKIGKIGVGDKSKSF